MHFTLKPLVLLNIFCCHDKSFFYKLKKKTWGQKHSFAPTPLLWTCPLSLRLLRPRVHVYIVYIHWGKADDRNCNYDHPKMANVESGKNLFLSIKLFL